MYIKSLELKNIGPFDSGKLEFAYDPSDPGGHPVTIITGVNGAGKSIVIDAIRAALSGQQLERNIVADEDDFFIKMNVELNGESLRLSTSEFGGNHIKEADYFGIARYFQRAYKKSDDIQPWIVDYWSSRMPSDSFSVSSIGNIVHEEVLHNVLLGKKSNVELTKFLCHIDYLRSSDVPAEKELGEFIYNAVKQTINSCLDNGSFKYIRRTDLQPIIEQNGHEITLEKLSSGNIFLIEHLVLLICKMYSLSVLLRIPTAEILKSRGLLLIDEIETHLHPRWQKSVLPIIRSLFPNLQIILTTHSPFVLSSLPGVRIYTCKPRPGHSEIVDETDVYSNLPVDEILLSDVFNVSPFNNDITKLMEERKAAIKAGKNDEVEDIESKLTDINPEYFSYMSDIDKELDRLTDSIK